jgi:hypothetical protein
LSIPSDLHSLPGYFVQAVLNKKTIYCSTLELISVSDRTTEAIVEALHISNEIITATMESIRKDIDSLFNLTDSVVSGILREYALNLCFSFNFSYSCRPYWICWHHLPTWLHYPMIIT